MGEVVAINNAFSRVARTCEISEQTIKRHEVMILIDKLRLQYSKESTEALRKGTADIVKYGLCSPERIQSTQVEKDLRATFNDEQEKLLFKLNRIDCALADINKRWGIKTDGQDSPDESGRKY